MRKAARNKVAVFLNSLPHRKPARVLPLRDRSKIAYPSAPVKGLPQFSLRSPVLWREVRQFGPLERVKRSDVWL